MSLGTPAAYLPKPLSHDAINDLLVSIGLPRAASIGSAAVTAAYHAVYTIKLPPNTRTPQNKLILRVSGNHLPRIKTSNEIGVMAWVARNTTIPIADVIAYDVSIDNAIGHEYTLLAHMPGVTLSDVYPSLTPAQVNHLLDQLTDILIQLHAHPFSEIGGLILNETGEPTVSRIVDEVFWQAPDIVAFWPAGETVDSLNLGGPYDSYVSLVIAQVKLYMRLISLHPNLTPMRDLLSRLEAFMSALPQHATELNTTKLILAHKDLHFANILYDMPSGKITAVLDWEFSGVVPAPLWDPRRAFLWNAQSNDLSKPEKERLRAVFEERCRERGCGVLLEETSFASERQECMQLAVTFLRAITEVMPRGERAEMVLVWREKMLQNLALFGV